MAKAKKVSISQMDKVIKEERDPNVTFDWNGATVEVKRMVPFTRVLGLVRTITDSCFAVDSGEFLPEVRELATRAAIVEEYSNVRLPDNIDHKYEVLFCTDIYDQIVQHIDGTQYGQVLMAVDERLDIMVDANIEAMRRRLDKALVEFENMIDQTMTLFNGVNPDDIEKVSKSIADNGMIDEKKLMQAYLEEKENKAEAKEVIPVERVLETV